MTLPPPKPIVALARLIREDRVVRVLCPVINGRVLVKDDRRTWWEDEGNLTSTGVRHQVAELVQVHPGAGRPCDTEGEE